MSSRSSKLLSPSSAQSVFIEVIKSALDRHGSLLRSHLLYLPLSFCSRLSRILCALDFNLFIVLAVEVVLAVREISLSLLRERERERGEGGGKSTTISISFLHYVLCARVGVKQCGAGTSMKLGSFGARLERGLHHTVLLASTAFADLILSLTYLARRC